MAVETASGNVELEDLEPASFQVTTDSGDIDLASALTRTREGSIRTESGDVTLRVGRLTPFDLRAAAGSGSVKTRGVALDLVEEGEEGAHFRRRSGGVALLVETGAKGKVLVREL
jgi:DUF4097 and DUF4098 domain-containing protein YvlB